MLSNLFYIITFSLSIVVSIVNLLFGFIIIIVVIINRQCRTVTNLLMCNTAAATSIYAVLQIFSAGYGLRDDWLHNQPLCVFRAYCYVTVCIIVSGSYALQSISRLFFAVLYKYKYLLTWRIHWFMIIANYLMAIVGPIVPVFVGDGYEFEVDSRLCMATTKVFYSSMLAVTIAYLIPLSIVTIIYGIIFHRARQSARRVVAFVPIRASNTPTSNPTAAKPNLKRELKLMTNIIILVGILICAGIPYLIMVLWHATLRQPPPEPFYLLTMVNISVFFVVKLIVLFCMSKEVKHITVEYLRKCGRF